jgi:putative endonuclease
MPKTTRQSLGQHGEQLAADQLTTLGYSIIDRNYHCAVGEIDIIAQRNDLWIFVEVRTRRGRKYGTPEESITPRKRAHLIAAAQTYLQVKDIRDVDWQIALVAVEFDPAGQLLRIEVIENAINEQ